MVAIATGKTLFCKIFCEKCKINIANIDFSTHWSTDLFYSKETQFFLFFGK